ncbi:MAG: GNAT family N-acetyltransferase [Propionibacteriales bacterium]|nr:GNAT family N-acetyltransferase [Propionibacteriales bacterium]
MTPSDASVDPDARDDLVLRPAHRADLAEIAELFIATRRDAVPAMPLPVEGDDEIRDWFAGHQLGTGAGAKEIWVAETGSTSDGEILGFSVTDDAWLDSIYVGPQHQGRGIGSALLAVVQAQIPTGFALWVFASNTAARGFYHRHGLIELEHTDGSANPEGAPEVRMAWPGVDPIGYLRAQIDDLDDELALLLARRFALTAAVQGYKANPGHGGRDRDRERAIAARMAAHTPGLEADAIGRIMHTVIGESLDAYDSRGNTPGH